MLTLMNDRALKRAWTVKELIMLGSKKYVFNYALALFTTLAPHISLFSTYK